MSGGTLVIGGDIQSVQTALDLADCGVKVTLLEQSPSLRANNAKSLGESRPDNNTELLRLMPKLLKAASHPNINILTNTNVAKVKGTKGDFRATVMQQPRYVNVDICASCARCEHECPVNIIPLVGKTLDGHKAIHRPDYGLKSVPSTYIVEKKGVSPCTAACPAGINVHGYIALISQGKFTEALDLITEAVAFPRILGRVCTHPCESKCSRSKVDQAVSICALKRFVSDNNSTGSSLKRAQTSNNAKKPTGSPRVAIIGAGPAGLTAARDLARLGHRSTVFEALPSPGGMVTVGIPRFRLPHEVRQADIEDIIRLGIEIRTSTPIGKELTLHDLQRQGYEAILIAIGAHKSQRLEIPGEDLAGVIDSITFLRTFNLKQPVTVGQKVVVIGGGFTAIDSARTTIRLHCERVRILYRRSLEEMPASPEEVAEAQEEGVEVEYLVAPVRIIGQNGKVAGVECIRMRLGEPDSSGRRRPIPIEGSEFFVKADTVIVAVGQRPDLSFLGGDPALTEGKKHIVVDSLTMATKIPGIFAAGDAAGEPGPMINAIAAGRRAALSIDRFLRGEEFGKECFLDKAAPVEVNLDEIFIPPIERQPMPSLKYEDRIGNFEEVKLGFTAEMAVKEAQRCLNCAVCSECLECERACELKAIDHNEIPKQIELEAGAIVVGKSPDTQQNIPMWDTEGVGVGLAARGSGIYLIPSLPDTGLSPASAVASRVMADLAKYLQLGRESAQVTRETSKTDVFKPIYNDSRRQGVLSNLEPRAGIFVCDCGGSISEVIDVPDVVEYCQGLDGAILTHQVGYACTEETAREIKDLARQHNLTHIVLAACSCCNLDQICFSCSDRRLQCKSNLVDSDQQDSIYYEFVNIREHCAWVHCNQAEEATAKAKSIIRAGLARAKESQPLAKKETNVEGSVLVVGDGLSGMQAAADLAAQGFQTILIRKYDSAKEAAKQVQSARQDLEGELASNGTIILSDAELISIDGPVGRYQATVVHNGKTHRFAVGAVVIDVNTVMEKAGLPSLLLKTIGNGDKPFMAGQPGMEPAVSRLPGVFLCGMGEAATDVNEALIQGSAAASKASVLLNRGKIETVQTVVSVDQQRCRGCGTCESVCGFEAIMLTERNPGIFSARVDEGLCRGCGICVAHCPSGALSQSSCSDLQISASLEAILS